VKVADIIGEQPLEMLLIERDHMIEQIASATFYPALGDAVLPRTLVGRLNRIDLHGSHSNWDFQAVFRVTIKDEELGSSAEWKCFSQLVDDPHTRRMLRDVEVQNTPPVVTNDEEAVENAERDGGNCEEVHCSDGFPMVPEKSHPPFGRLGILGARRIQREIVLSETSKPSMRSSP
jgi:hypothetical protein